MNYKALIAASILSLSGAAQAVDYSVVVHAHSYHTDSRRNNNTKGVGLVIDTDSLTHIVGTYTNSDYRQSVYYMTQKTYPVTEALSVGWWGGIATDYQITPIMPLGGLAISYQITDHVGVNINHVPNIAGLSDNATMFSLTFK